MYVYVYIYIYYIYIYINKEISTSKTLIRSKNSGRSNDSEWLPGCAGAVGQSGQLLASHAKRVS